MSKGIDVSSHQGTINWQQVRTAGYEFAFIRASRGNIVDDRFVENWQNARAAGVLVAPYHVVYDTPTAAEQVALLLSLLPAVKDFPLVLDVEVDPPAAVLQRTREMLDLLKDYHTVIYTGAWWWDPATAGQDVEWAAQADLWTVSYTATPYMPRAPWKDWRVWQYTNEGRVPGISGNVDLNNFNGNDLYEWWMNMTTIEVTEPILITMGNKTLLRLIPPYTEPEPPQPAQWAFPIGNAEYPPEAWYAASLHDPTGALNNGYKHTGLDLNLDKAPWGDVERILGLAIYAIADGVVTYLTDAWSGVPMIVIKHEHNGAPLWTRYAHILPTVTFGETVKAGQTIGAFANYTQGAGGDHLHFDMATDEFTREWLTADINWIDPVPVLKVHLNPNIVDEMLKRS
jgi:lysozyme